MSGPIAWFIRNPVATNLAMWTVIAAGLLSLPHIEREVFPEFSAEMIVVTVPYPGATPNEVEEAICVRVEEEVAGLEDIEKLSSTATENGGSIVIKLREGADVARALDDVKARVDAIDTFPVEAEEPVVAEVVMRRQVLSVAISGPLDERGLRSAAERVRDELMALPDVTLAELVNVRPYEIAIEVSEDALRRHRLSFDDVANAVRRSSLDLPGGSVRTRAGEILLRTKGQAYSGDQFEELVVLTRDDGTRVLVRDVATVVDGFAETDQSTRFDGAPTALVNVFRVDKEDAVHVSDAVHAFCANPPAWLPEGVRITPWFDQSLILKSREELLVRNGLQGFVLVFLILTLFLRFQLAFWVAAGIPLAFLGAFAVMPWIGASINMLSLFAFVLVLGIVVDDAIVVGENVFAHSRAGRPPRLAAEEGAREVALPVAASVLTTVAAFLPMFNIPGLFGRFFSLIPMVVIPVLLISLLESTFLLPAHLRHFHADAPAHGLGRYWRGFQEFFASGMERFARGVYRPVVDVCLRHRAITIAASFAMLLVSVGAVAGGHVRFVFFPEVEGDNVIATLTMPQGTPVEVTTRAIDELEAAAFRIRDELTAATAPGTAPAIAHVLTAIGEQPFRKVQEEMGGRVKTSGYSGSRYGEINLQLAPSESRSVTSEQIGARWRALVGEVPGAVRFEISASIIKTGADIDVSLRSQDLDDLQAAAARVQAWLAARAGVFEIGDSFDEGKEELALRIRREAEAYGLGTADLARQVRQGFYGEEVQRVQRGRDDVRVMVRYPRDERRSLLDVESMRIRTRAGDEIPIATVAESAIGRGYAAIQRTDRARSINVTAKVDKTEHDPNEVLAALDAEVLPSLASEFEGLRWTFEGEREEQKKTFAGLGSGFAMALLLIYALMAIPFRSYLQPLLVMTAIPFGLIGAILGHVIMGLPLSVLSMCGIVALSGVVVNDAIVLVDFINRHRSEGGGLLEAVREAGVRRFRPIMLTSLTTFGGLMPLVMEKSVQALFLVPMAISLAFGVMFATFITLVLVPAGYLVLEDLRHGFRWLYPPRRERPH
ncbi:MAG: efflux RND transporter permease subunit [Planctomycetes bacterium]|nr:efflux RND transporter permease subunit [Planctomycetota bacterium]